MEPHGAWELNPGLHLLNKYRGWERRESWLKYWRTISISPCFSCSAQVECVLCAPFPRARLSGNASLVGVACGLRWRWQR